MSTIEKLSHRIFNTTLTETQVRRASNQKPVFKTFQANILTGGDVFESAGKVGNKGLGINDRISAGTKRIYSTFVGSINDFGKKFYDGIESIKDFGHRMKESVVSFLNKVQEIGNTEVRFDGIKNGLGEIKNALSVDSLFNTRKRSIAKMATMDPHAEIKPMFSEHLKALEADIQVAKAA